MICFLSSLEYPYILGSLNIESNWYDSHSATSWILKHSSHYTIPKILHTDMCKLNVAIKITTKLMREKKYIRNLLLLNHSMQMIFTSQSYSDLADWTVNDLLSFFKDFSIYFSFLDIAFSMAFFFRTFFDLFIGLPILVLLFQ